MPTYRFREIATGKEFDRFLSFAERDVYLEQNQGIIEQAIGTPIALVDSVRIGVTKADSSFRDLVKHIKKKHRGSTIKDH